MWKFRTAFWAEAQNVIWEALTRAGYDVVAKVTLIGISPGKKVWCEPEEFPIARYSLANLCQTAQSHVPGWVHQSRRDPCHAFWMEDEYKSALQRLASLAFQTIDAKTKESFLSPPVQIEGDSVMTLIQISSARMAQAGLKPHGHGKEGDCFGCALIHEFFDWNNHELEKAHPGANTNSPIFDNLLRDAGKRVMFETFGRWHFFSAFTEVSSMYYERSKVRGTLQVFLGEAPSPTLISFPEPIPLEKTRTIRKLLEMCDHDQALICSNGSVIGMSGRSTVPKSSDPPYEIHFANQHEWRLQLGPRTLMTVSLGLPSAPKDSFEESRFRRAVTQMFPQLAPEQVRHLASLVSEAAGGGHGTMLVISGDAEGEAVRLRSQATRTSPTLLTESVFRQVSRIDGAVICSPEGSCYAIGAILDGPATPLGDTARGSRYNSAIRFVEYRKNCLVVVVSDDGMVDLIEPQPPTITPGAEGQVKNAG